jgi:uncharacterized protein YciI
MALFAVTTIFGPNWDGARGRREQEGWDAHAAFMDELVDDGFVIMGGPIRESDRNLLIIEAADESEIEARFRNDPWAPTGLLRIHSIEPWTIWLDGRGKARR